MKALSQLKKIQSDWEGGEPYLSVSQNMEERAKSISKNQYTLATLFVIAALFVSFLIIITYDFSFAGGFMLVLLLTAIGVTFGFLFADPDAIAREIDRGRNQPTDVHETNVNGLSMDGGMDCRGNVFGDTSND